MSFLLDTNICSAYLKQPRGLTHRFLQHMGHLSIASVVLAELYDWAYRRANPHPLLELLEQHFLPDILVYDFDASCAKQFGQLRGTLEKQGITVSPIDLMIASVALTHNLTLVTHNTQDFQSIPQLRLQDWLTS